ncbi:hypothetical protein Vi05172_g2595 [Venturia inaequalis]|nr:hypothetical protein Vi05172_g2595 [Venturia inaequalis]
MPNFMDLSGELRNKIYRYCFVLDAFVNASSKGNMWTYYYRHKEVSEASSQFLRVSKTIYREGSSILYGENRIYAQDYNDLKAIVGRIGLNALYVRELKLDYDPDTVCLSRMFAGFHNLNTLYFTRGNEVEENTVLHAQHTLGLCPQVQSRDFGLITKPEDLPRFSKDLLERLCSIVGLELYLDVFIEDKYFYRRQLTGRPWPWEGTYRYRIIPTPKECPENCSLIEKNYDLVFKSRIPEGN